MGTQTNDTTTYSYIDHVIRSDSVVLDERSVVSAYGREQLCVWEPPCIKELRKTLLS